MHPLAAILIGLVVVAAAAYVASVVVAYRMGRDIAAAEAAPREEALAAASYKDGFDKGSALARKEGFTLGQAEGYGKGKDDGLRIGRERAIDQFLDFARQHATTDNPEGQP